MVAIKPAARPRKLAETRRHQWPGNDTKSQVVITVLPRGHFDG